MEKKLSVIDAEGMYWSRPEHWSDEKWYGLIDAVMETIAEFALKGN